MSPYSRTATDVAVLALLDHQNLKNHAYQLVPTFLLVQILLLELNWDTLQMP